MKFFISKTKSSNNVITPPTLPTTKLVKKPVRSGGSRNITIIKFRLPISYKHKTLKIIVPNKAGCNNLGRRIVRTKGSRLAKYSRPKVNYTFRSRRIGFVGYLSFVPFLNKVVSTMFFSSGSITHLTTTTTHKLLKLVLPVSALYLTNKELSMVKDLKNSSRYNLDLMPIVLTQLPKNRDVCLLERLPYEGVKYTRSVGVSSKIIKMDSRTNLGIVILPSGLHKIFSIHGIGSIGKVRPLETRKFKNTKSGYYRLQGLKSTVRGVAMNPVDHPHGGRTKTLKYPRTPWGKTTKYK